MQRAQLAREIFSSHFTDQPALYRAPGRINLIGEHTDYNLGFVLPAAISQSACLAISPSTDGICHWVSADFKETVSFDARRETPLAEHWANYLLGVVDQFRKAGFEVPATNLVLTSDVPIGAGLSSSAALESVMAYALNEWLGAGFDRKELALLAQRAENSFIGLQCGIMDMFTSLHGKKDHAIRLDCRTLDYDYFPLELGDRRILLLNTGVSHSLASSAYNERRAQCQEGVDLVKRNYPSVNSLRDVSREWLDASRANMSAVVYKRCAFVIEENERVQLTCQALQQGNLSAAGQLMYASHRGLRDEYEVSCRELDLLERLARQSGLVVGARMMGGGFGGCTINLIPDTLIERFLHIVLPAYREATGIELKHYVAVTGEGAEKLN
jgi:galactokinase